MHFPNIILKQMIAFSRRRHFPCAHSKNVNFVCSDPCAELGELDVWDSFSVNNTCLIALNLLAHDICKLSCGAKGQITNASRLQAYSQVASREGDVMRQKLQPLVEPP